MNKFFKDWDFKKHAKIISAIYMACYAIDMTLGYLLIKKTFDKDGNVRPLKKA